MDYYSTLGLKRGASDADIKKAYRSMAMKHHPDRGGDEKQFKEIEEAYRFLSDPQKKQMVDSGLDPNQQHHGQNRQGSPFEFHFGGGMEDIFNQFGFGFGGRPRPRNRTFNVNVTLTLEEVLTGKEISAEIGIPNGQRKMINISVPAGIANGQNIRYQGMGDNSIKEAPAGDLIVNISIVRHSKFERDGDNLIYNHRVSVWEAMLGGKLRIETLDKKSIDITIPAGTQPDTVLSCKGEGLPNIRNRQRGNLLIKVGIDIPKNLTDNQKSKLRDIQKNA
jgi:curved DNA-binding protein